MSDDKDELSDDEYAALLRDLEGRASGGGSSAGPSSKEEETDSGGVEDIDAFLSSLEAEADSGADTVTSSPEDDALAMEFAALEERGELLAPPPPEEKPKREGKKKGEKKEKKSRAERRQEKREEKEAAREAKRAQKAEGAAERSRGKAIAIAALVNFLWIMPALIFWWVLGAFLGQWVSAGWLIAAVSTMFVFVTPLLLRKVVKRGDYRPWLLGLSLVATVALIAPMPHTAGQNLSHYGHWPSSAVAELFGWQVDAGLVRTHASVSGWVGSTIAPGEEVWTARQLGTAFPLDMEGPVTPGPATPGPETEPPAPAEGVDEGIPAQGTEGPVSEQGGPGQGSPEQGGPSVE